MASWVRVSAMCALVGVSGCVDRVITEATAGDGFGDSEGDFDGDSDTAAELPPEPEPIPQPLPPEPPPDPGPDPECTGPQDCADGQTCFEGTCVGTGEFRVSLSWQVVSDFDLHVRTPSGIEIWYGEPQVASGYLDVDDCVGGDCRNNDGTHVENVFFNGGAERGVYQVWIVNFDGVAGGDFRIEVAGATNAEFTDTLPRQTGAQSQTYSFEY